MNWFCRHDYHLRLDIVEEHFVRDLTHKHCYERTRIERCRFCALVVTTRDIHQVIETVAQDVVATDIPDLNERMLQS